MLDRIKHNPAVLTGAVVAVLVLVTAFGVPISDDQKAAIVGVVSAVLALLGGVVTRSQVTPARDVVTKRDPVTGRFVAASAHAAKTGTVLGKPEPDGKDTP